MTRDKEQVEFEAKVWKKNHIRNEIVDHAIRRAKAPLTVEERLHATWDALKEFYALGALTSAEEKKAFWKLYRKAVFWNTVGCGLGVLAIFGIAQLF